MKESANTWISLGAWLQFFWINIQKWHCWLIFTFKHFFKFYLFEGQRDREKVPFHSPNASNNQWPYPGLTWVAGTQLLQPSTAAHWVLISRRWVGSQCSDMGYRQPTCVVTARPNACPYFFCFLKWKVVTKKLYISSCSSWPVECVFSCLGSLSESWYPIVVVYSLYFIMGGHSSCLLIMPYYFYHVINNADSFGENSTFSPKPFVHWSLLAAVSLRKCWHCFWFLNDCIIPSQEWKSCKLGIFWIVN